MKSVCRFQALVDMAYDDDQLARQTHLSQPETFLDNVSMDIEQIAIVSFVVIVEDIEPYVDNHFYRNSRRHIIHMDIDRISAHQRAAMSLRQYCPISLLVRFEMIDESVVF
jgi:hypothetical protein